MKAAFRRNSADHDKSEETNRAGWCWKVGGTLYAPATSGAFDMGISGYRALGALFATLCGTVLWAAPASAENPFIAFLRGDWLRPANRAPVMSYAPPTTSGLSITVTPRSGGGGVIYCVRTCDGRYFPLSGASSSAESAAERCASFCPASPTRVFTSHDREAGIDAAFARDGSPYSSLPNAYSYRTALDPSCRCNTASTMGVADIDIMDDPTLRPGDMVVTATGVKVFRGDKALPHDEGEFSQASADRKLSASMRRQVEALEIASGINAVPESRPGL